MHVPASVSICPLGPLSYFSVVICMASVLIWGMGLFLRLSVLLWVWGMELFALPPVLLGIMAFLYGCLSCFGKWVFCTALCPVCCSRVEGLGKVGDDGEKGTLVFSHKGQNSLLAGAIWIPSGAKRGWREGNR